MTSRRRPPSFPPTQRQALAQLPADKAGVGATLKTLGGSCGACHQAYRIKKD